MKTRLSSIFHRTAMILLMMLLTVTTVWAWDGNGTENDPYRITDADDLAQLASNVNAGTNYTGKYFQLRADITYNYGGLGDTESNYAAIGNNEHAFCGHFDGQGHTISGIRINKSSDSYQGLFGCVGNGGSVNDVKLTDTSIAADDFGGGIIGYLDHGSIENCLVVGVTITININNKAHGGAIVGGNNVGTFSHNYYNNCKVNDDINSIGCGGGNITGNDGAVRASLHAMTLADGITATGLLVKQENTISVVVGATVTLSGATIPSGFIFKEYSVKNVSDNNSDVTVTETDGVYTFTMPDGDVTVTATWTEEKISGLTYNATGGYYEIPDEAALNILATYVNNGHNCEGMTFMQTNPITLTANFAPIGQKNSHDAWKYTFSGTYDGNNQTISGLSVSGNYPYAGLFGYIYKATVKNVCLISPVIASTSNSGDLYAGALVGRTYSTKNESERCTITNCIVINPTVGFTNEGGSQTAGAIIGDLFGSYDQVTNCYFYDTQHQYTAIGASDIMQYMPATVAQAYHITLGDHVIIANDIPLGGHPERGFVYDNGLYYRNGIEMVLSSTDLVAETEEGYCVGFSIDDGQTWLDGNTIIIGTDCGDVTIIASNTVPLDWTTVTDGTADAPYQIKNTKQVELLAQHVNNGKSDYQGKYFELFADLLYQNEKSNNHTAIGTAEHPFRGNFNGASKFISFVNINKNVDYQGFFGYIDGATISNIQFTDSQVSGNAHVGGIVGYAKGGSIQNCLLFRDEVTGADAGGLIIGDYDGTTLTANFHTSSTYNTSASGIATSNGDVNGAFGARKINLADGVAVDKDPSDPANGFLYGSQKYFRDGLELTVSYTAPVETNYSVSFVIGDTPIENDVLTVNPDCDGKTISPVFTANKVPQIITYMKADGTTAEHEAIPLDGSETTLKTGWYYVGRDISFDHSIAIEYNAKVNIILCNGKTMNSYNFTAADFDYDGYLAIYGQSLDPDVAGTLNVTSPNGDKDAIIVSQYFQHSGNVMVNNDTGYGIFCYTNVTVNGGKLHVTLNNNLPIVAAGNITINGGQVFVQSLNSGLGFRTYGGHDIVLGWTNPTDYIYSPCYETWNDGGKIRVADGKALINNSTLFTNDNFTADDLCMKYLYPAGVVTFDDGFGVTISSIPLSLGSTVKEPDTPTLAGYTFLGWYSSDNIGPNGTKYNFDTPVNGLLTLYAKWSGAEYGISYDLAGGELPTGESNPATFTIDSNDFTLVNPIRKGYTFEGWTGTGLTAPTTTVTIAKGSMASRQYTATWNIIDYTISYDLAGGELPTGESNPATFNIESNNFTLVNPVRAHYAFAGWTGYDLTNATEMVTIYQGSTENRSYTATWIALKDFTQCTAYVPNPTYDNGYYIGNYFAFDASSIVVKGPDGNQLSDLEYSYAGVVSLDYADNENPCTHENEHCQVILEGFRPWDGVLRVDIIILPSEGSVTTSLSNTDDNSGFISALDNAQRNANVTLEGRTLYKDGAWNTLCLPFDVTISGSVLDGAEARTLNEASITGSILNLTFSEPVSELTAGTPYIIKWASGDNLVEPVFTGVTVSNATNDVTSGNVSFKGTYSPITWDTEDKSILLVGGSNLYWPMSGASIGACRAYFKLDNGQQVSAINMNFDATGIETKRPTPDPSLNGGEWYDLSGRKLDTKPTAKGLYIMNGKKVVIK